MLGPENTEMAALGARPATVSMSKSASSINPPLGPPSTFTLVTVALVPKQAW